MDVDRELGAVAHRHVAVARGGNLLVVDVGARRRGGVREDLERVRLLPVRAHLIAVTRGDVAEQRATKGTGLLRPDGLAARVHQRDRVAGLQTRYVDLVDAAVRAESGRSERGG